MARDYERDRYGRRYEEEGRYDRDFERSRYDRERLYGGSYGETSWRGQRRMGYGREDYGDYSDIGYGRNLGMGAAWGGYGSRGYSGARGYETGRDYEDYDRDYEARGYGREGARGGEYGLGYGRNVTYPGRTEGRYGYGRGGREDYERGYGGRGEERGWWDRATDEVSSWFGDEEAEQRRRMDEARRGQHRGRGPRGYQRSDERIREDINDRLTDHPFLDASDIEVSVNNGEVTLSGTVNSRDDKRLAEDIAEDISGVKNVENRLRVSQQGAAATGTMGTTATGATETTGARGATATTGRGRTSTT
ncbi:MAG TPA: BON domain-containing protein [Blastocatellia bacterium]|nr:BON domain-containing protein [Blastocatellia bacterium]